MTRRKRKEQERDRQCIMQARAETRNKMCNHKKLYNTLIEAEGYAKLKSDPRYGGNDFKKGLRAYHCPLCNKFHLTSSHKQGKVTT